MDDFSLYELKVLFLP